MAAQARYNTVAVALHWAIALIIVGNIAGGVFMHNLPNSSPIKFDLYQLHKSFGLAVLALSLARLGWRLTHKVPALPERTPAWQRLGARAAHWGFYALMIATPLAGWAMVSVSPTDIPTYLFGVIPVPHLPFFAGVADRAAAEDLFAEAHEYLAFAMLGLLALHIGAALKHRFLDRDSVLQSMAMATRREWAGFAVILAVLGFGAAVYALAPATGGAAVAQEAAGLQPEAEGAGAANWTVDYDASRLGFSGMENDQAVEGAFSDFAAEIYFDPDDLDASWILVAVAPGSAATGDSIRDSILPGGEWFNVNAYPAATFVSRDIRQTGEGAYEARGALSIKQFTREIVLPFTLEIDGDKARATGGVDLIRTDFGLGEADAWLETDGVALEARVDVEIVAVRNE